MATVIFQWLHGVDASLAITIALGVVLGGVMLVLLNFMGTCLDYLVRHFREGGSVKDLF